MTLDTAVTQCIFCALRFQDVWSCSRVKFEDNPLDNECDRVSAHTSRYAPNLASLNEPESRHAVTQASVAAAEIRTCTKLRRLFMKFGLTLQIRPRNDLLTTVIISKPTHFDFFVAGRVNKHIITIPRLGRYPSLHQQTALLILYHLSICSLSASNDTLLLLDFALTGITGHIYSRDG